MYNPDIYLVDNGSLSPTATIQLRELAKQLSLLSSHDIQAVSLLHSHKVPKEQVGNIEVTIVKRAMKEAIKDYDMKSKKLVRTSAIQPDAAPLPTNALAFPLPP